MLAYQYILTYVHDQIPDQDDSPADGQINVPEPKAKEDGVVGFIAQLGPEQEEVVPKEVAVIDDTEYIVTETD